MKKAPTPQLSWRLALAIFVAASAVHCARHSGSSSPTPDERASGGPTEPTPTPTPTPSPTPDAREKLSAVTTGYWFTPCQDMTSYQDLNIKGLQTSLQIAGYQTIETQLFYRDKDCRRLVAKFVTSSSFDWAAEQSATEYKLNLKLGNYVVTPLTSEVAAEFNARAVCHLSAGWFEYGPRDVTGLECEPLPGLNFPGRMSSSMHFDIVKISTDTTPATVRFGNPRTGDGTTESSRPTGYTSAPLSRP